MAFRSEDILEEFVEAASFHGNHTRELLGDGFSFGDVFANRERAKQSHLAMRANPAKHEAYKRKKREYERAKYAVKKADPVYRESRKKRDEAYREKLKTDPTRLERRRQHSRDYALKRKDDPAFKAKARAAALAWYHRQKANPEKFEQMAQRKRELSRKRRSKNAPE